MKSHSLFNLIWEVAIWEAKFPKYKQEAVMDFFLCWKNAAFQPGKRWR